MHCMTDWFVACIVKKRLLSEKDLTLGKALAIAVSMEAAAKDALELQKKAVNIDIRKMSMNDVKRQERKCYRCGKTSHDANNCWFKDKNCRKCSRQYAECVDKNLAASNHKEKNHTRIKSHSTKVNMCTT